MYKRQVLRGPIWLSGDVRQPAHGFKDPGKAGSLGIRARLTKAREAQHDQMGIVLMQGGHVQAPAIQRPGSKIFNQHIELADHLQKQLSTLSLKHI